jgi:hypothetical protein
LLSLLVFFEVVVDAIFERVVVIITAEVVVVESGLVVAALVSGVVQCVPTFSHRFRLITVNRRVIHISSFKGSWKARDSKFQAQ